MVSSILYDKTAFYRYIQTICNVSISIFNSSNLFLWVWLLILLLVLSLSLPLYAFSPQLEMGRWRPFRVWISVFCPTGDYFLCQSLVFFWGQIFYSLMWVSFSYELALYKLKLISDIYLFVWHLSSFNISVWPQFVWPHWVASGAGPVPQP